MISARSSPSLSDVSVLVVDDSGLMRLTITEMIQSAPGLRVVDSAADGKEAVEKCREHRPDVIVMDLVMGKYDGLYAIKSILAERSVPIIVLSSLSASRPEVVFEALEAGAFDFIAKPGARLNSRFRDITDELISKVREATLAGRDRLAAKPLDPNQHLHPFGQQLPFDVVAIGASTGGPRVVESILTRLPGNFPLPIVIAQHMPAGFVRSFARRLHQKIALDVKVAEENESLQNGQVYLASGDANLQVAPGPSPGKWLLTYTTRQFPHHNHPSVDALFESVGELFGNRALLAILSGMGRDGVDGMQSAHRKGAFTIAQDEASSVVFGMPKAAIAEQVVRQILPEKDIPGFIVSCL